MKVLAIGDLVGKNAINKLKTDLNKIQEKEKIDFTVVNIENVSDGSGVKKRDFEEISKLNIDVYTLGNHTFGKKDVFELFEEHPNLIRPANYPKKTPGNDYFIKQVKNEKICTINLMGRTSIGIGLDSPFEKFDEIYDKTDADLYIVDFHGEATAEKKAFGHYVDGRATIVFGTHTHVQTADEEILPKGTGYITDLGMCGPRFSIIGMDIDVAFKRFLTSIPERYKLAEGECSLEGAIFDVDDFTKEVKNIKRIQY